MSSWLVPARDIAVIASDGRIFVSGVAWAGIPTGPVAMLAANEHFDLRNIGWGFVGPHEVVVLRAASDADLMRLRDALRDHDPEGTVEISTVQPPA
jgi:hypothetical protein